MTAITGKLVFLLLSLGVSVAISYLSGILRSSGIKDRRIRGLRTLCDALPCWIVLSAAVALTGENYKIAVYLVKVIFVIVVPYMTFWFVLNFIELKITKSRVFFVAIVAVPALDVLSLLTGPLHKLYFRSFESLPLTWGPLFVVHLVMQLCAVLFTYIMLIRYIIINYRKQPVLIITGVGAIVPAILNILYLLGHFGPDYDLAPLGYFFTIIAFAYVSYYQRLRMAKPGQLGETLARIARAKEIANGTMEDAARLISKEACLAMNVNRVRVWTYDAQSQTLKCVAAYNNTYGGYEGREDSVMTDVPGFYESIASERVIVIEDTREAIKAIGTVDVFDPDLCAMLFSPVRVERDPIGAVCIEQDYCVDFPERREWNQEEQSFVSSLSDFMAIAIANVERRSLTEQLEEELSKSVKFNEKTFEQLQDALHKAKEASRAKTEFVARMSHELRTPMNAIMGMTELALREDIPELIKEHVFSVKQAGSNLLGIINDILDFSKIEAGKIDIASEDYSIASLINNVVSITRARVSNLPQIRFIVRADSTIPRLLNGDESRIRQALLNILSNAVKYTMEGFVSFAVHIDGGNSCCEVNDEAKGETKSKTGDELSCGVRLVFEVEDSGIGITPENIEKLFTEFDQLDLERSRKIEGIGLGLAITKGIVSAMDGEIDVESEFGKGSKFTIAIPQKCVSREVLAKVKKPNDKSILVYERRQLYIDNMNYTLRNLGLEHTIARNEADLLEKLREKAFDFLFLPYALFKKSEKAIQKNKKDTKIVILTEFGEVVPEKRPDMLYIPTFCTYIADVLNGVHRTLSHAEASEAIASFIAPEARVLVVDDININLHVAKGMMSPYNMCIDFARGGQEAVEAVQSERYDLVFMDHKMPDVDGVEATRRIRELGASGGENDDYYRNLPIVALTANAMSGVREMFVESGFNDFLSKPIDIIGLGAILENWIPKEKQVKKA